MSMGPNDKIVVHISKSYFWFELEKINELLKCLNEDSVEKIGLGGLPITTYNKNTVLKIIRSPFPDSTKTHRNFRIESMKNKTFRLTSAI